MKDRFLLKVAIKASLAKLNHGKQKDKVAVYTKGRKLLPKEMNTQPYVFDVLAILKKSRMESSLAKDNQQINLNHLSMKRNKKYKV